MSRPQIITKVKSQTGLCFHCLSLYIVFLCVNFIRMSFNIYNYLPFPFIVGCKCSFILLDVFSLSSANKCLLKVGSYSAQLEQYPKAIEIFEQVSGTDSTTLLFVVIYLLYFIKLYRLIIYYLLYILLLNVLLLLNILLILGFGTVAKST